ncbi:hypothetical protein BDZ94DRAFT_1302808 [Collybia nuda]|uniref:Zinc finger PHD-type domain-containing protein n=1 Tax=Collybia nuda TaxID=64659 RepID=A0A9P6CCD2_9AGAR|nr:hypothetical protein BDZ94DRAFT_1302808 [Collybia nuda]
MSPTHVIQRLRAAANQLPLSVAEGTPEDALAGFAEDPKSLTDPTMGPDELWEEFLNAKLKAHLGWGVESSGAELVRRGSLGISGLLGFVEYFIMERGVSVALFEEKLNHLLEEIDTILIKAGTTPTSQTVPLERQKQSISIQEGRPTKIPKNLPIIRPNTPIDVDAILDPGIDGISTQSCKGFILTLQPGQSPLLAYPFGIHDHITIPWDYSVMNGIMTLRARSCDGTQAAGSMSCIPCQELENNEKLQGILRRMADGAHENAHYAYYGFSGMVELLRQKNVQLEALRLKGLNHARRLKGQAASLSDHKRFLVAVASGKFERVERLVRVALRQRRGIQGIIKLYHSAAAGVYSPKGYTEEDDMCGLLLWKLGGNRIAQIAHRALGLPGVTTLRNRSTMPPIIPSPSSPTTNKIGKNIDACFVLMFNEIAIEKCLRWDPSTNIFLGVCREHSKGVSLEFNSEGDLEELFDSLDNNKVHYAGEATIAALGILSQHSRLYAARPILISGDCKKEDGEEHAEVIRTVLEAVENKKETTKLRVVSIASDGETRRGAAFVILTFKHDLPPTSNMFLLLSSLQLMNLQVGEDDLTCDKDWKHVFKRIQNLLIRTRGVVIQGFRVTPSIIKTHLQSAGLSSAHIHSLFNPDDKQNVKMAFDLLKDIWSLPPATEAESKRPGFSRGREALRILGKLLHHIVFPYLCVDLSLSEQLEHLSAAPHLLLVLYCKGGKEFFPTLLFTDIMIMIKNVFFCVAKAKVDDPEGYFWIILLGTDRLEELFGILHTMIGNDANLDIYQLVGRLTGTTEVSNILAKYPQWDRSPRRLNVPAITRDSKELPDKADHIKPASWRGDVSVGCVTLLTCWRRGRRLVEDECPFARNVLRTIDTVPGADILSPNGVLIINVPLDNDDHKNDNTDVAPSLATAESPAIVISFSPADISEVSHITQYDSAFGSPCLILQEPIATLISYEKKHFLCIGEVNNIQVDGQIVEQVGLDILHEDTVKISYQVLGIVPATNVDDPELTHDWRSCAISERTFSVPGRLIQPINPAVSTRIPGNPYYLFESGVLLSHAANAIEQLAVRDVKLVPKVPPSSDLPYREASGKACFICESDDNHEEIEDDGLSMCPNCSPTFLFDPKQGQHILSHIGAHILYDVKVDRAAEPCGLCLQPSSKCQFVLVKGKGAKGGLRIKSVSPKPCANMLNFAYGVAVKSTTSLPCSNVPIKCPLCSYDAPAIWHYNMKNHFTRAHPSAEPSKYKTLWTLDNFEKEEMKKVWAARLKVPVKQNKKPNTPALVISQVHSSRLALRISSVPNNAVTAPGITSEEEFITDPENDDDSTPPPDPGSSDGYNSDDDMYFPLGPEPPRAQSIAQPCEVAMDETLDPNTSASMPPLEPIDHLIPLSSTTPPAPRLKTLGPSDVPTPETVPDGRQPVASAAIDDEVASGTRLQRKRKVLDVGNLSQCLCGNTVFREQTTNGEAVRCKRSGCETEWYHLICIELEMAPRNWICDACMASGEARGGKRRT